MLNHFHAETLKYVCYYRDGRCFLDIALGYVLTQYYWIILSNM